MDKEKFIFHDLNYPQIQEALGKLNVPYQECADNLGEFL